MPSNRGPSRRRDDPLTRTPFELTLPRHVSAPGVARRILKEWFATSLADDQFDTAKLLTSELVNNAVLHGRGTITVRADLDEDRLLVEVMDEGTGFERTVRDGEFEEIGGGGPRLAGGGAGPVGGTAGAKH